MESLKKKLEVHTECYWWNMGSKTLDYEGPLKGLLNLYKITYIRKKTDRNFVYIYYFKTKMGISFKRTGTINDFTMYAKQVIQMELVMMGEKAQLYVQGTWRPTVTVNF